MTVNVNGTLMFKVEKIESSSVIMKGPHQVTLITSARSLQQVLNHEA